MSNAAQMDSVDQDYAAAIVSDALRRHVGPGKANSYAQAAEALGGCERTVKSWCVGDTTPRTHDLFRLMRWLGPTFVNDLLRPNGFEASPIAALCGDDYKLNRSVTEVAAVLGAVFGDDATPGHIDHRERPQVVASVRELQAILSRWLAKHAGPRRVSIRTP